MAVCAGFLLTEKPELQYTICPCPRICDKRRLIAGVFFVLQQFSYSYIQVSAEFIKDILRILLHIIIINSADGFKMAICLAGNLPYGQPS